MTPLLEVEHLSLQLVVEQRHQTVLHDVSFSLRRGEVLALVGESGSGKSMTARAILRLLPPGALLSGSVAIDGAPVHSMRTAELRRLRSERVGVIFQDPRAAINPVHRIDDFLTEALVRIRGVAKGQALQMARQVLAEVGIDDPDRRLRQFPHELSGGMLQRMMIASVLLIEPALILADEPTTALDVTTQSEVMSILNELRRDRGTAMLLITHDLELAAAVSDRIAVMYAGYIVEDCSVAQLRTAPLHPYTAALLASRPALHERTHRIPQISGRPLSAFEAPDCCPFRDRCQHAAPVCATLLPEVEQIGGSLVRCLRAGELRAARAAGVSTAAGPSSAAPAADVPGQAGK